MSSIAGRRVLVVEDDALIGMMLEEMLGELGAEVAGIATTVEEALAMAVGLLDVAIVDVNLRGRPSYPAAEALAARGVPVVFATGNERHAPPHALRDAPTLPKPYDMGQVEAALAGVLV